MEPDAPLPVFDNLNKAQKFVRLVELMQLKGGISAEEAMRVFELDSRTLRRYLADMRGLDLPIRDKGRGRNRMLSLDPSYRRMGVQLSLLEVVSLHFGRSLFDFLSGTQFAQDLDDAIERVAPVIGRTDADLARYLDRKLVAVPEAAKEYARAGDMIDEVLSALLYQNPSSARYSRVRGPVRTYRLQPYTLATYRQSLYLIALDEDEGKVKTFALDRFKSFKRKRKERFDYPDDYDPKTFLADCFGITGGNVSDVVLAFGAREAPYIQERIWHHSQVMEPGEDGGVLLRMRVGISAELVRWVLSFGPEVQVVAPETLATEVRRLHWEAAHGRAPGSSGLAQEVAEDQDA